ncbi:AraC family transcriptional regulator [Chitinophaga alhagiae]|uniref:AraC family transcriptional regulator n=1 Tax=Chitinophaga alhagiae TaxID=2203219 RepID=UPI000E5B2823|nr:AraC family transcriptional regulator [Chitinophaga alhagiae]
MINAPTFQQTNWILPPQLQKKLEKHPLGKNLYITEMGFSTENSPRSLSQPKGSPHYSLLYCAHGKGWYDAGRRIPIKTNQFVIIPKKMPFSAGADARDPWRLYTIQFNGLLADEIYSYLSTDKKGAPRTVPPLVGRIAQFDDIHHHLDLMNNIENLLYANFRFYSFLGTFRLTVFNYMKKGADNIIERSILIMKQHLHTQLTLADLARETQLSASYLSALFKEKTKYSPIQLFTSLKIQKASQLLKETKLSIKQIAQDMGYTDQYSFSRSFKLVMGTSPKQFREERYLRRPL